MGEVYKARDTRLGRFVAIKTLRPELAGSADARERFEREARAISKLSHPHVCAIHDVGQTDGIEFQVMELLDGEALSERIAKAPLSIADLLGSGIQKGDRASRLSCARRRPMMSVCGFRPTAAITATRPTKPAGWKCTGRRWPTARRRLCRTVAPFWRAGAATATNCSI
jgi:hypothetical protein